MLYPHRLHGTAGLRRRGPFRFQARDADPQFRVRLGRRPPRYLVLVADGIDRKLEPTLYLDVGEGFSEARSAAFRTCGRFVCCLDLRAMGDLREVRLDPMAEPGLVGFVALSVRTGRVARWLTKRLALTRVASGRTRVQTISDSQLSDGGLDLSRYRSVAEHYADVIALHGEQPRRTLPTPARPLIAFLVPTYDTKVAYLDALLASFRVQVPGLSEIVFSDDGSSSPETLNWLGAKAAEPGITVIRRPENRGIAAATDAALHAASAPWIALVDHDDALSPGAVDLVARALDAHPDVRFLYTDEVVTDEALRPVDYHLKPAYDPVLLSGVNYINHLSVYRRDRLQALGGFRQGFEGSQDYEVLLRYLDGLDESQVLHLPYPAYLWRRHKTSFSTAFEDVAVASARRALAEHHGGKAVEPALAPHLHRVRFDAGARSWPRVSVVIPNRDSLGLMTTVLDGLARTDYPALDIVVVDNDSSDPRVLALYDVPQPGGRDLRVEHVGGPFNFSRSINRGMARASGEMLLLLNNDIEVLEPGWLKEMVACFAYADTGIVGARLLYPDRTLQHAGVVVGLGGLAGHWYVGKPETAAGPMGRLAVRQSLTAVTGAAMLVSRRCIDTVGPLDEERFAIAYNDIDLCLRARAAGFRIVWTPFATLVHHESVSRGSDATPANIDRFHREQRNLRERHRTDGFCDRAFNPWFTRDRSVPQPRALDALPEAR